jgi:signal transduction histidine kinase
MHPLRVSAVLTVILLFFYGGWATAQSPEPRASSELPRQVYPAPDTAEITALLREAQEKQYSDPAAAEELLDNALQQSRLMGYHDGAVWALFGKAGLCVNKGAYAESRKHFREAYTHCLHANQSKLLLPTFHSNMAMTYVFQGNYSLAMYYYYVALQENKSGGLKEACLSVLIYGNLAGLLIELKQYEQARYYLALGEKTGNRYLCRRSLAYVLNNKGNLLLESNDYKGAEACYHKSLELGREIRDVSIQQAALSNLGHLCLRRNQPGAALTHLEEAMALNRQANPFYAAVEPLYLLGNAYAQLGKYDQAEATLKTAVQKAQSLSVQGNLAEAYKSLARICEATGRHTEALAHWHKYIEVKDSLVTREKIETINQLEVRYRTLQKDRELAEKELLISRQQARLGRKNVWLTGISAGAVLLAVSWVFLYRAGRQRQRLQDERIRNLEQQQQIAVLQAMVSGEEKERSRIGRELHDGIGGMLSALKMNLSLVSNSHKDENEAEVFRRVYRLLDETTAEVRKTAHNLMPEMLFRHGLAAALAIFCDNISQGNTLTIDFQSYGNLEDLDDGMKLSIYRTVQELVQNIARHADATEALVQVSRHQQMVSISVEDNGKGFDVATTGSGIGLQNLQSRTRALNGSFSLLSEKGLGTKVYIEFNLQQWSRSAT